MQARDGIGSGQSGDDDSIEKQPEYRYTVIPSISVAV